MKGNIMKVLILTKQEKEALISLLSKTVQVPGCSYELTTVLEKLSPGAYERAFQNKGLISHRYRSVAQGKDLK